ncbi:MAG: alpha/beta fold hydrolase [Patescibacteria group bacterium]|nr:alpha/beta fold hydrolase [Patescibacteria group bacterium]
MIKKLTFIISSLAIFNFALSFNIPYQFLVDYDKDNLIIKVINTSQKHNYYICQINTKKCSLVGKSIPQLAKNENIFINHSNDALLWQVYDTNIKRFKTFLITANFFNAFNINRKLKKVFWSEENKNDFAGLFANQLLIHKNGQEKLLKIPSTKLITVSPSLKKVAYLQRKDNISIIDTEKDLSQNLYLSDVITIAFSDDNNLIIHTSNKSFDQLWLYNLPSNKLEKLFDDDFIIDNLIIYKGKIYFIANLEEPLEWNLYEFNPYSKELKKIIERVVYEFKLINIKNFLIAKISGQLPPKIILINLDNFQVENLDLNLAEEKIETGEIVKVENIYSVLLKPEEEGETDLIVWLHGGPMRQTSLGYHPYLSYGIYDYILEQLRKDGKMIVKIDYVGSWGYGKDFQEKLKNNIGNLDVQSVLTVVNKLRENYKFKNIYLMGNSYGGYLALKVLYEQPEIFTGAISINGVTDWWTLIGERPSSVFRFYFSGSPNKNNKFLYDQASIYLEPARFRNKKILLIYGANDKTIPPSQSKMFYLKYNDIANIQLKSYENEGHMIVREENLKDLLSTLREFINY